MAECNHSNLKRDVSSDHVIGGNVIYTCTTECCRVKFICSPVRCTSSSGIESINSNLSESATSESVDESLSSPLEQTSRLDSEFDDLSEELGEGGFGAVRKYKNKLDGKFYAIKRIKLDSNQIDEETQREVKLLSGLCHQNVVRYFTCWFEDYDSFPER